MGESHAGTTVNVAEGDGVCVDDAVLEGVLLDDAVADAEAVGLCQEQEVAGGPAEERLVGRHGHVPDASARRIRAAPRAVHACVRAPHLAVMDAV
jgi:hypothetical protein